jgi:signal transduction histidine kinase
VLWRRVIAGQKPAWIAGRGTSALRLGGVAAGAALLARRLLRRERRRQELAEAERARLTDQLLSAEQEERRRLALFLHDVPVQAMSGIALMLDGVIDAVERGASADATRILRMAVERQRETIRELRNLSFALEPVVLRDRGFGAAVEALAEQVGLAHRIQVELDVAAGEALSERAQATLYQIIREAIDQAVRRGPPTRIRVSVTSVDAGAIETVIEDDSPGERRRRSFDELEERARTLQGRVAVETTPGGAGTAVRVTLPPYTAQR